MTRVIIESPYAGDVDRNVNYARACILDSLRRGEAPIASHLLYTQPKILNDDIPEERDLGILAGLAWLPVAKIHTFYVDLGWSKGMREALNYSLNSNILIEFRRIMCKNIGCTNIKNEGKFIGDYCSPCWGKMTDKEREKILCGE